MAEASVLKSVGEQPPARLNPYRGVQLGTMMFLQYAIWGLWAPILNVYLGGLPAFQIQDPATGNVVPDLGKIGLVLMTLPIASIVGPFIGGQIADRYFAAQRFLGVSQILGGVVLLAVARLSSFGEIFVGMLIYNLLYAPTIGISNSITFQHWPNERFSWIRVWGSIGWIAIAWIFGIMWMEKIGPHFTQTSVGQLFYFGAAISILYGIMAFFLPHTPPKKQGGNQLAFLEAARMMRNPAFAIMAVISFLAAMDMQLYFTWSGLFLEKGLEVAQSRVGPWLTAGQICEMVMMVILPFVLRKIGFRYIMALGVAAWGLRDLAFAIGAPTSMVLGAISLHGVGYAFFFTVIFMFADAVASEDIKSSAQSFLASVTIGCGMLVGSLLSGPLQKAFASDWSKMFLVPAVLLGFCCLAFLVAFRPKIGEQK